VASDIERQFAEWLGERFGPNAGIAVALLDREYALWPEEESHVAGAVPRRRIEFSTGRDCARRALHAVGFAPGAIPAGIRGGPIWPEAACGSIAHSGSVCAAVAARRKDFAGLGIDVVALDEATSALRSSASVFASATEIAAAHAALADGDDVRVLAVLFSAKESAIKAMSERFDRYVEFTGIQVEVSGANFTAACPSFGTRAEGWWAIRDGYLFTAAVLR
jgi:4'-phosphopantetheinyl transferase EntD